MNASGAAPTQRTITSPRHGMGNPINTIIPPLRQEMDNPIHRTIIPPHHEILHHRLGASH